MPWGLLSPLCLLPSDLWTLAPRTGPVPRDPFLPWLPPRSLSVGGASSAAFVSPGTGADALGLLPGSSGRVLPAVTPVCRAAPAARAAPRLQAPRVPVDRCTWPCARPGFPGTSLPLSSGVFTRPQIVIWKWESEAPREKSHRALLSLCVRGPRLCLAPGSSFTHEAGAVTGAVRDAVRGEHCAVGVSSPCERQSAHNLSVCLDL